MTHLLLLPGIFIHELSHLIMGFLLNAKPVNFSIIPNSKQKSAGHVAFKNITFYNALPVGIAPTIVGPGLLYIFWQDYLSLFTIEYGMVSQVIFYYLAITILYCCAPSSQDIKVIFKNPLSILLYGVISYIIYQTTF
jgi:hypothetical protein